jgi:hypothetical protein
MKTNPLDLSNHLRYVDYRKNGWTRIVYSDGVVWKLWRFDCVGIVHKVQVFINKSQILYAKSPRDMVAIHLREMRRKLSQSVAEANCKVRTLGQLRIIDGNPNKTNSTYS